MLVKACIKTAPSCATLGLHVRVIFRL